MGAMGGLASARSLATAFISVRNSAVVGAVLFPAASRNAPMARRDSQLALCDFVLADLFQHLGDFGIIRQGIPP